MLKFAQIYFQTGNSTMPDFFSSSIFIFLSNLYAQRGARTHAPETENRTLSWPNWGPVCRARRLRVPPLCSSGPSTSSLPPPWN